MIQLTMKLTTILLIFMAVLIMGCTTPTEPQPEPEEMSVDSLLGVIDTLTIQLGHNRCLVYCMAKTLDSLNITMRCECGI